MTGLIWLVQLVHYPSFAFVYAPKFERFHAHHSRRITWIVFPMMTAELILAVALAARKLEPFWILNLSGLIFIWLATAFISVPLHNRLACAPSADLAARLVLTNWPRTLLWSARAIALLYFIA